MQSLLLSNDGYMRGIDEGNDKGNMRIAPVIFRIGEDCKISTSEGFLYDSDNKFQRCLVLIKKKEYPPISPATSESNPEKMIAHSLKYSGLHSCTRSSFTICGIGVVCFQLTALGYSLPADRGDAPRTWIVNQR